MKKIAIIAFFGFFLTIAKAQDFTGIGIFKIGSDSTVLFNFAKENNVKIKEIDTYMDYIKIQSSSGVKIALLKSNKDKKSYSEITPLDKCPDVKEYFITQYQVAGLTLKKVRLLFYKNQLNKVSCDFSRELLDAVNIKYGQIPTKTSTDTVNCLYKLTGITQKLVSTTFSNNKAFGNINFRAMIWDYYDDHCQKSYNSLFEYELENKEHRNCTIESNKITTPKVDKKDLKDF